MGNYSTKRILKELHIKRNMKKLFTLVEAGNARAMEKIGTNFFCRVLDEDDDIDIFEGMLSAFYWFDKAVEFGKIDSNYWIGETIDLYCYCGIGGQAYYGHHFREFIRSQKCKCIFHEVLDLGKGYLFKILKEEHINFWENKIFYQKVAEVGDSSAAFRLGEIYLNEWCRDYIEHLIDREYPKANSNDLKQAEKYLYYALTNGEPEVVSLMFKIFDAINSHCN